MKFMVVNQKMTYSKELIFNETVEEINKLEGIITEVWELLITTEINDAMTDIYSMFNRLEKVIGHMDVIRQNFGIKVDIDIIFKMLAELESAMKIPDYILMSDIIEYEIKKVIIEWKTIIQQQYN